MWTFEAPEWLEKAVVSWKMETFATAYYYKSWFHTLVYWHTHNPHTNVTGKLQLHVSNHQLLYLHPLNHPHPPNPSSPFSSLKSLLFSTRPWIRSNKYKRCSSDPCSGGSWNTGYWGAGTPCHTAFQHSSFHWTRAAVVSSVFAPQNVSFRQTCHIRLFAHSMGFCVSPFEWLSKSALSVSECTKTLFPWKHVKLGRGGPFLTGHSSIVKLLHVLLANRAWVCGNAWLPVFSNRRWPPHKKWFFSKNHWVFCKKCSTMSLQVPENILEKVWGRNSKFHILTYFSSGRYRLGLRI